MPNCRRYQLDERKSIVFVPCSKSIVRIHSKEVLAGPPKTLLFRLKRRPCFSQRARFWNGGGANQFYVERCIILRYEVCNIDRKKCFLFCFFQLMILVLCAIIIDAGRTVVQQDVKFAVDPSAVFVKYD